MKIVGTGSFAPENIVTNVELERSCQTSDLWIKENLGIEERRVCKTNEYTSDLATRAALCALEDAGLEANDLDMIILATATPDRAAPSTACIVQEKIGCTNSCPAFDVSAVCSGFLYSLTVASQFIESGQCKTILVIGADTFSKITDWSRRDCVFFGDGAGAVVVQRTTDPDALFSSVIHANGKGKDSFTVYPDEKFFTMDARAVYNTAVSVLPTTIQNLLDENGLNISDVRWMIPHQPSVRVLRKTAELLSLPQDKLQMNMARFANTAGATVPLLLDEVNKAKQLKPGDLVVFAAVGSGWTWGAALYRWLK